MTKNSSDLPPIARHTLGSDPDATNGQSLTVRPLDRELRPLTRPAWWMAAVERSRTTTEAAVSFDVTRRFTDHGNRLWAEIDKISAYSALRHNADALAHLAEFLATELVELFVNILRRASRLILGEDTWDRLAFEDAQLRLGRNLDVAALALSHVARTDATASMVLQSVKTLRDELGDFDVLLGAVMALADVPSK